MPTYALVDCNNFYVSCERVFRPELEGRPVAVLSNNDGCAVSRSNEAKAIGVAMGEPAFKLRHLVEEAGLVLLSSNYALYGDLSERVMSILAEHAPASEVYSIDECFLDLDRMPVRDLESYCRDIRATVRRWTGIPVAVGVAPTKTLAKLANRLAKKSAKAGGVLDLASHPEWIERALRKTDVADVWGIGQQWSGLCYTSGVRTAWDLAHADDAWVRKHMGMVGLRTVLELRGTPVHSLETEPAARQTCCCSRSFGEATSDRRQVHDAVVAFASRAAEKVRKDMLVAGAVQVFIQTDRFRREAPQYSNAATVRLSPPSADTIKVIGAAARGLDAIWREGFAIRKAGVVLLDLIDPASVPRDLFAPLPPARPKALMAAMDAVNARFGRNSAAFGLADRDAPWRMRQEKKSPSYTSRWEDVPRASA